MNAELTVQVNKIEVTSTSARKIEISSVGKQGAVGDKGDVGNPGISAYQLAVDNGFEGDEATWLESMKVKGDPAPQVRIEYSPDGDEWHSAASDGDNYLRISVDDGDTWGSPLLARGLKGDKGDAAPSVSTEYSLDGVSWSSAYTDGDAYLHLSVDGGITWGSSLTIRGSKGDPGDKGDKGEPGADGDGIPSISDGDSGKVLAVKLDESGAEWSADYAPLASPALTGSPTAPTQADDDDSTKLATTAYVKDQVASDTVAGMVELATSAETLTGTDTVRAVTPKALADTAFYRRGNLLGTVSQSGGVPTGAVIERGSNANGEYVKFADGTMIATAVLALTATNNNGGGTTGTLPATFISSPSSYAAVGITSGAGTACRVVEGGITQTTYTGKILTVSNGGTVTGAGTDNAWFLFVGRWF